jgi:hypothetical protein
VSNDQSYLEGQLTQLRAQREEMQRRYDAGNYGAPGEVTHASLLAQIHDMGERGRAYDDAHRSWVGDMNAQLSRNAMLREQARQLQQQRDAEIHAATLRTLDSVSRPKQVYRDANGQILGLRVVQND